MAESPYALTIVDAHHHVIDPAGNGFQSFLASVGAPTYLPEQYAADAGALNVRATVHIEAMPDDGLAEAAWVESLAAAGRLKAGAIVGLCNLADPDAGAQLDALRACSTRMRGVRCILDWADGPFDAGKNATHVFCSRTGKDYLRDPAAAADFERGFALLAERDLSFDLQCAPQQLEAAATLCGRHPAVRVVIDHMGKPRHLRADGSASDEATLAEWRAGMARMAALPQVHVKLSMLGYAVPGWHVSEAKEALLRSLVVETIELFGARRCMFASNFHVNGAVSDSDGACDSGPSMPELYAKFAGWATSAGYGAEERARLFAGTAAEFYRV